MEQQTLSGSRRAYDRVLRFLLALSAVLTCALLLFIIGYIFVKGLPHVTWELLSSKPSYIRDSIGILPNLVNTVFLVVVTLLITLPLGVGAAVYLTASMPRTAVWSPPLNLPPRPLPVFPLSSSDWWVCSFSATSSLWASPCWAGALTLVIMTLPTIIRTTQESLKTVPQSYREGALGLGAGKWHMIRTLVLPSSIDGIVTGCILAVGRIVGESAALLFTAGMGMSLNNFFSADGFLHSSGASLTVALYVYAKERAEFDVAFGIAAILMLLTLLINLSAKLVGRKLRHN